MNYPRMLYRPGETDAPLWGEQVQTRTVESAVEESAALRDGWMRDPSKACKKAKRRRLALAVLARFTSRWEVWLQIAISIAGLVLSYQAPK